MSTELLTRRMRSEDLEAGLRLTQAEGWSHRLADWEFHYRLGRGWVVCNQHGAVLGTTLWWAYGERFGTIGLVVVDRAHQGKGIGRRLMNTVLEDAGDRTLQLIATQAGLKLYRQCGFEERHLIAQHQGNPDGVVALQPASGTRIRAVSPRDLQTLCDLDSAAMGASRNDLVAAVLRAGSGALAERDGRIVGFALARESGRGTVIGPVIAEDESLATALISHCLKPISGFARVDIPAGAQQLARWLQASGLACVDRVTSMLRGPAPHSSPAVRVFGIVSQALS